MRIILCVTVRQKTGKSRGSQNVQLLHIGCGQYVHLLHKLREKIIQCEVGRNCAGTYPGLPIEVPGGGLTWRALSFTIPDFRRLVWQVCCHTD